VSYGTASLRGVINVENGPVPEGARFTVQLTRPGENGLSLRPPQVDARGHFLIEGLPAGVYEVTAYVIGNVKQLRPSAKRTVNLADGVVTDITLTVDLAP